MDLTAVSNASEDCVERYESHLRQNSDLPAWEIIKEFDVDIKSRKGLLNLLVQCTNSKMESRHWNYVQNIVDWKFDFKSDYFNFHNLLSKKFTKFELQILNVIELASKEDKILKVIMRVSKG